MYPTESGTGANWHADLIENGDSLTATTRAQVFQVLGSAQSSITGLAAGANGKQTFRTDADSGGNDAQMFTVSVWGHLFGHGSVSSEDDADSRAVWQSFSIGGYYYVDWLGRHNTIILNFAKEFDIPPAEGDKEAEEEEPLDDAVAFVWLDPSDLEHTAFSTLGSEVPEVKRVGAHSASVTLGSKAYGAVSVD